MIPSPPKNGTPPLKRMLVFLAGLLVPHGLHNFIGTFSTHQRVGLMRRPCAKAKPLSSIRNPLHSAKRGFSQKNTNGYDPLRMPGNPFKFSTPSTQSTKEYLGLPCQPCLGAKLLMSNLQSPPQWNDGIFIISDMAVIPRLQREGTKATSYQN